MNQNNGGHIRGTVDSELSVRELNRGAKLVSAMIKTFEPDSDMSYNDRRAGGQVVEVRVFMNAGHEDNATLALKPGDRVECDVWVEGYEYDGRDGNKRHGQSLNAASIRKISDSAGAHGGYAEDDEDDGYYAGYNPF